MKHNPNHAMRDRFALIIPDLEGFSLKVTACPIPNVSTEGIRLRGSTTDALSAMLDGDSIEYAPATWQFIVDEDLENYSKLLDWLVTNTTTQSDIRLDGTMLIYDSAGRKIVRSITYTELHPIDLGEVDYGTDDETSMRLMCTITMRYTDFKLSKPGDVELIDIIEHVTPEGEIRIDLEVEVVGFTFDVDSNGEMAIQSDGSSTAINFREDENGYLWLDHNDLIEQGQSVEIDDDGYLVLTT